ncbi:hypothetical protein ScPMuIL_017118 [Solemya velum]
MCSSKCFKFVVAVVVQIALCLQGTEGKESCKVPDDATGSVCFGADNALGSHLEIVCECLENYTHIDGDTNRSCDYSTGATSGKEVVCWPVSPPVKPNAVLVETSVHLDNGQKRVTALYECIKGTHLKSGSTLLSSTGNTWVGNFVCEDVPDYIGEMFIMTEPLRPFCILNPHNVDNYVAVQTGIHSNSSMIKIDLVNRTSSQCTSMLDNGVMVLGGFDIITPNTTVWVIESMYNIVVTESEGPRRPHIPVNQLGYDYVFICFECEVHITAIEGDTEVLMKFWNNTRIILSAMESFKKKFDMSPLSGEIVASKKITVNIWQFGAFLLPIAPATTIGNHYCVYGSSFALIYFVAADSEVGISYRNEFLFISNKGDLIQKDVIDAAIVKANKPILVVVRQEFEICVQPALQQILQWNTFSINVGSKTSQFTFLIENRVGFEQELGRVGISEYASNEVQYLDTDTAVLRYDIQILRLEVEYDDGLYFIEKPNASEVFTFVMHPVNTSVAIVEGLKRLSRTCKLTTQTMTAGDGIDNDCDGKIDEELCQDVNGDVDGDGLIGEDCFKEVVPPVKRNATVADVLIQANTSAVTAVYKCDPGFELINGSLSLYLSGDEWVGDFICGVNPPVKKHASVIDIFTHANTSVVTAVYRCDRGFGLINGSLSLFLSGDKWIGGFICEGL